MSEIAEKYRNFIREGERLDASGFPWPVPKKGDKVRARCLFDRDPESTQFGYFIEECVTDCVITKVEPAAGSAGNFCVYYEDIEGRPFPQPIISTRSWVKPWWGGVDFWDPGNPGGEIVPLYAIKKGGILAPYANLLKRRVEAAANGVYS